MSEWVNAHWELVHWSIGLGFVVLSLSSLWVIPKLFKRKKRNNCGSCTKCDRF